MGNSLNIKKLKIPFLIKKSGKIVFINNHKGYEISNITNEMIDFVNQLLIGVESNIIDQYLKKNNGIKTLYVWLQKKEWISTDVANHLANTANEKNYEYINSLNKNPHELLTKLRKAHVAIVGCGGTGSIIAQNLVAMGFLQLSVIDYDKIEFSNLNRQTIFSYDDVGKYKAEVLATKLKLLNNDVKVITYIKKIQSKKDLEAIYDKNSPSFMVCGIDTPPVLSKINVLQFCASKNIPCIFGGVGIESGNYGPLIDNDEDRKLFEISLNKIRNEYRVEDINLTKGSLCPTNSIIASFMALDVFKWFSNTNPLSLNKISHIDFKFGAMKHNVAFGGYSGIGI